MPSSAAWFPPRPHSPRRNNANPYPDAQGTTRPAPRFASENREEPVHPMSHESYRDVPQSDVPPTKPMNTGGRPSAAASWIALILAVAALIVGYAYLVPDAPSPAMRAADNPPSSLQPEN